jgi:hypothetical protein
MLAQEEERSRSRISWTEERTRREDKTEDWRPDPRTVRTPTQSLSGSHRDILFLAKEEEGRSRKDYPEYGAFFYYFYMYVNTWIYMQGNFLHRQHTTLDKKFLSELLVNCSFAKTTPGGVSSLT